MKTKAILMTIAMMSAALAGCTGSDGVAEIDDETLQELFEDNIQDFMNNTSVTVNQEIHYHNNTTSVDNSESVTNFEGGDQGTSMEVIRVMRVQQNYQGDLIDYNSLQFMIDGELQFPSIGFAPILSYNVGGDTYSFSFTCQEALNALYRMYQDSWAFWAREEFQISYSDANNLGDNIYYDIQDLEEEIREYCNWGGNTRYTDLSSLFLTMEIPEGEAISFKQFPILGDGNIFTQDAYYYSELLCDDGYLLETQSATSMAYIGGWSDCEFSMYINQTISGSWEYSYSDYPDSQNSSNNSSNSAGGNSNYPSWYNHAESNYWYTWSGSDGTTEIDGVVYYSTKFVVPVE
tara:strand:+ start:234 stop:1277 length:1044 start_codon:yes stop_codon:yes gene_type:complete